MAIIRKLTWEDVLLLSDQLGAKIMESGVEIDVLIGLARGGWIPTRLLSDRLNVKKIASIGIGYEDEARTELNAYSLPGLATTGLKFLLIEDRLESGKSLRKAFEILCEQGAAVQTAAYFSRTDSVMTPDYCLGQTNDDIIFPWE